MFPVSFRVLPPRGLSRRNLHRPCLVDDERTYRYPAPETLTFCDTSTGDPVDAERV